MTRPHIQLVHDAGHAPILQDAPPGAGTAAVRADLEGFTRDLDGAFDTLATSLAAGVEQIERVVADLIEIASLFESGEAAGATAELTGVAQSLCAVPARIESRAGEAAAIGLVSAGLRRNTSDISRCLRGLEAYGMNMKITASGLPQFADFADRLRGMLRSGFQQLEDLEGRLDLLASSLAEMRINDRLLLQECSKVLPAVPDALMANASALRDHQSQMVKLMQAITVVANGIREQLGLALGAMQVGDRARQRIEHVVQGCTMLDDACASLADSPGTAAKVRAAIVPLLAAQASAAATEFAEDGRVLHGSIGRLGEGLERLSELQSAQMGNATAEFLSHLEQGVADAAEMITQLDRANAHGRATMALLLATVADVAAKVTAISELRLDVRYMSINIGMSCRNLASIARPVMVIANEIRSDSDRLSAVIGAMGNSEAALLASSDRLGLTADETDNRDGGDLGHFLAIINRSATRADAAIGAVEKNVIAVRQALDSAVDALSGALESGDRLPATLARLAALAPAGGESLESDAELPAVQALADRIAAVYTMAGERDVHNAALPAGLAPITIVAPAPEVDDEDDGLF